VLGAVKVIQKYLPILKNGNNPSIVLFSTVAKKFLAPEEVADMTDFLLSDKASSISGQIFEMDCGIVSFKI